MYKSKYTNIALISISLLLTACSTTGNQNNASLKSHNEYDLFLSKNKNEINVQSKKLYETSKPYKEYIENEASKYNMPTNIYAIAAIESGYNKNAVSTNKNMVGMWQLNYFMAKEMGLTINKNIDERHDWKKSTTAAIQYINKNAEKNFNKKYDLAILAYYAGTSNVKKAISDNNSDDVWILLQDKNLADNYTKSYFFKYMAYSNEFKKIEISQSR